MIDMDDDTRSALTCGIIAAAFVILIGAALVYLKFNTYIVTARVQSLTWKRVISVQQYKAVAQDTNISAVPSDAYDIARYTRDVPYTYICGEMCHESCYGTGKSESCTNFCSPKTCTGLRPESWETYKINRWVFDHDLTTDGTQNTERAWHDFTPQPDEILGHEREQSRAETFYATFVINASGTTPTKQFVYSTNDYTMWVGYHIESDYTFQVNRLEEPQWNTIKESSK